MIRPRPSVCTEPSTSKYLQSSRHSALLCSIQYHYSRMACSAGNYRLLSLALAIFDVTNPCGGVDCTWCTIGTQLPSAWLLIATGSRRQSPAC